MGEQDTDADLCRFIVEQARHMENRGWNSLNNFLVSNAFIAVAWATLYSRGLEDGIKDLGLVDLVMVALSVTGFIGGVQWAIIGARNWRYVREWSWRLKQRRNNAGLMGAISNLAFDVQDNVWAVNADADAFLISSHEFVLGGTPLLVGVAHLAMLEAVLWKQAPEWLGPAVLGVGGALLVYGVGGVLLTTLKSRTWK